LFEQTIMTKIRDLENKFQRNIIKIIAEPIVISCIHCGTSNELIIAPETIAIIIENKPLELICPSCEKSFKISLADIIRIHII